MATEKQAAYFATIFDKESERTKVLRELAKVYVGLTSVYSAFLIFATEKMLPHDKLSLAIFVLCISCFICAFGAAIQVLQVAAYERPSDPYRIIEGFGEAPPSDADFFDHRIIDLSVSASRNALVNDSKARYVSGSGYLILAGLSTHAVYFVVWVVQRT